MSEWQTIDSAPRDGTPVLLWLNDTASSFWIPNESIAARCVVGWFDDSHYRNGWLSSLAETEYEIMEPEHITPTHWMPIPDPPVKL